MKMYGLRHSLLTWLASEGIDLMTLRTIAGHKKVSTTFDIYIHSTRRHHAKVKDAVSNWSVWRSDRSATDSTVRSSTFRFINVAAPPYVPRAALHLASARQAL